MSWNHRVMKQKDPKTGEVWFAIHEVYYDDDPRGPDWRKPHSYTTDSIDPAGETLDELRWVLEKMLECLDKPVLTEDDFKE